MKKLNRRQTISVTIALVVAVAGGVLVASGTFRHDAKPKAAVVAPIVSGTPRPENVNATAGKTFSTYPGALPGDLKAAPVGDGTFVAIDPSKDLPDAARVALQNGGVAAIGGGVGMLPTSSAAQVTAYGQYAVYSHTTLGKWVVLIAPKAGKAGQFTFWTYDNGTVAQSDPADLAETTKAADAWASTHRDSLVVNASPN